MYIYIYIYIYIYVNVSETPPEGGPDQEGARCVWQQSGVVGALWEQVMEQCSARERQLEEALVHMEDLQASMSSLALELEEALGVQEAWEPLGDLLVDALQDHIDAIKVRRISFTFTGRHSHFQSGSRGSSNLLQNPWIF